MEHKGKVKPQPHKPAGLGESSSELLGGINVCCTSNDLQGVQGDFWGCVVSGSLDSGIEHSVHDSDFCVIKD